MKSSKNLWLISCVIGISLVAYLYFKPQNIKDCDKNCLPIETNQPAVEHTKITVKESPEPATKAQNKANKASVAEDLTVSNKELHFRRLINKRFKFSKKNYDEQWCYPKYELSQSDYQFAQTELKDWQRLIGLARAGNSAMAGRDQISFPNNSYIESYEALPFEQLQALALQGDKWAMVTYMQDEGSDYGEVGKIKDKIANELLIQGGSYYALDHIVSDLIGEARMSIEQSNEEQAIEHIADALAHAYWGLEHYSDSGLDAFIAVAFHDDFSSIMKMEEVLPQSVDKVRNKLAELTNSINEQRAARGIDFPEPPPAIRKWFGKNVAIRENISEQPMALLRSLNITEDSPIKSTLCSEQYLYLLRYRPR